MTTQSADRQPRTPPAPQPLFTPGPRLGWTFRNRRTLLAPFPEPPPNLEAIDGQAAARLAAAQRSLEQARKWGLWPSVVVFVVMGLIASQTGGGLANVAAVVLAVPGLAWYGLQRQQLRQAKDASPQHQFKIAYDQWAQRAATWRQAELTRLAATPEWGSAGSPAQRTDVFGGTLAGWQALLTVHGASIASERPLLVADLSGQHAAVGLAAQARQSGVPVAEYLLPRDLDRSGLLARLTPAELATALAEGIHAGTPGGARADRAIDVRVLQQLCSALADGGITPARLAAAIDVALGRPGPSGLLTPGEADLIRGTLFPDSYKTQISTNLVRLDAFWSDLARHAGTGPPIAPDPAYCTLLAAEPAARSASAELLAALVIEWLTVQVTSQATTAPAVIIAAADQITRPHLERLAEACEHRGVPLTLLFRHLRDDAVSMAGGGATAFMRLGNHHEAEQAATFIGRRHMFVLSQFTATRGAGHTSTRGASETWSTSKSRSSGSSLSLGGHSLTSSRESSKTHGWGTENSESDSMSWSQADTIQRVYEYAVEPTVLQDLPDNALLLIRRSDMDSQLQAVECDPEIAMLPHVSLTSL
jgi:hypothetical protein